MADFGLPRLLGAALLVPTTLTGCASLAGSPPRAAGIADSLALLSGPDAPYRMDRALRAFDDDPASAGPDDGSVADLRHGLTRQQYRNMVVALYLNAADARYGAWRSRVSDERRVGRQSFFRSLTAAAPIMAGTHGAIDRNIYFDRTLPGLLASMDAERLRIRAEITRHLSGTEDDYPLAMAFADIRNYELAASLDRAIEQVAAQAAAERQAAQREYDAAIHTCHVTEDVSTNRSTINLWARSQNAEKLRAFATRIGANLSPTPGDTEEWQNRIRARLSERYCTNAELADLIASEQMK